MTITTSSHLNTLIQLRLTQLQVNLFRKTFVSNKRHRNIRNIENAEMKSIESEIET